PRPPLTPAVMRVPYTSLFRSERRIAAEVLVVRRRPVREPDERVLVDHETALLVRLADRDALFRAAAAAAVREANEECGLVVDKEDRKSTRLNSSHVSISYAVF